MNILYKYYSSSLELENYLLNPTIRLSQISGLNDPFEGKLTDRLISTMTQKMISAGQLESLGTIEKNEKKMRDITDYIMNSISVVALTETQRNLLMWAHYASEHRGCCIGYQTDFISEKPVKSESKCFCYTPKKINYDDVVFDDEQIEAINKIPHMNDEVLNKILHRAITTKSDEWIYEKEHRLVLPIEWSDEIIIRHTSKLPEYVKKIIDKLRTSKGYKVVETTKLINIYPSLTERRGLWKDEEKEPFENALSKYKDALFLKKIDSKYIKSIYLGMNYPKAKKDSLIQILKANKDQLGHIDLYSSDYSKERFDIKTKKIHGNSI